MSKIPDALKVKVTVSNITVEIPKPFFEQGALKAAVFVGRKGKGALTRRTKWFTLADPSTVPSSTRQILTLPPRPEDGSAPQSRSASTILPAEGAATAATTTAGAEEPAAPVVMGELAVMQFGAINNAVYEVEMRPLNKFEGDWVFDQKLTHPLTVFAKVVMKNRPNAKGNVARSELDSNLHEMLQMDQSEMDEDFSGSDDAGEKGAEEEEAGAENIVEAAAAAGVHLTVEQLALLNDGKDENQLLMDDLQVNRDVKKRYIKFPKTIDVAAVVNTKAKSIEFSERIQTKSASLIGSVISFTVSVEVNEEKLNKYEAKKKEKEDKEDRKRREKEEKVMTKQREKEEKKEAMRREEEKKKRKASGGGGGTDEASENYGLDVTHNDDPQGAVCATETTTAPPATGAVAPVAGEEKKASGGPFSFLKSIFSSPKKVITTPFPIKMGSSPYPFLFMLDKFVLEKLTLPPEHYEGVHLRMGFDSISLEKLPLLLLNAKQKGCAKALTVKGYDGADKNIFKLDFGPSHIYFADSQIRYVTGFDTIRALTEHERNYVALQRKMQLAGGEASSDELGRQTSSHLFHEQILDVGERFVPIDFQPTKYSTNDSQVIPTKFTRVTAQLIVPNVYRGERLPTDQEEKREFLNKLRREEAEREKEERRREKEERKAAEKEAKAAEKAAKVAEKEAKKAEKASKKKKKKGVEEDPAAAMTTTEEAPPAAEEAPADAEKHEVVNEDGENIEEQPTFESEGTDAAAVPEKDEKPTKIASQTQRIVTSVTKSFQLGNHLINEENVPQDGVSYRIRFMTGEELTFRARRVFLPSICHFGERGASTNDVPLLSFSPNA